MNNKINKSTSFSEGVRVQWQLQECSTSTTVVLLRFESSLLPICKGVFDVIFTCLLQTVVAHPMHIWTCLNCALHYLNWMSQDLNRIFKCLNYHVSQLSYLCKLVLSSYKIVIALELFTEQYSRCRNEVVYERKPKLTCRDYIFINIIFYAVTCLHIYLSSVFIIISSEWRVLENHQVWS